jgi:hypothetical protein
LIDDVRVFVLKMFSLADSAGTHAGISKHTMKLLEDYAYRVSLFVQEIL